MPQLRKPLRLPVPTVLVVGSPTAGKTTALAGLVAQRPAGEQWAVLRNDGGGGSSLAPGADSTAGVTVRQLSGGCACCSMAGGMEGALAQLVRTARPHRLFIELSGLGSPSALLATLRSGHLSTSLTLGPVVCLVDATHFAATGSLPEGLAESELFAEQVAAASVLVGSRADLCDAATLECFHAWAAGLLPPKQRVLTAVELELGMLLERAGGTASPAASVLA